MAGTVPRGHVGFNRALHHSPLAHAELVAGAFVVERLHGALKDVVSERLMIGAPLRRARSLENFHVEPLVSEEAFIPRHQQRQIVNGIHHGDSYFLERLGRGTHWVFLSGQWNY